jgi:hypothetical protein
MQQAFHARHARADGRQRACPAWRRELLRDKGVGPGARWSKSKELLAGDERYRALPREAREAVFRAFIAEAEVCAHCLIMLPGCNASFGSCACNPRSSPP